VSFQSDEVLARDPTRAHIGELPVSRYQRPQSASGPAATESCSICIVDFEEGEEIKVLPCAGRHKFHTECIDNWLKINPTCCLCRTPVFDATGRPITPQAPSVRA